MLFNELNEKVLDAYGWSDIDLKHGFHLVDYLPKGRNLRYMICESARLEILRRLSELNRQRHEEEVAKELHGGTATRSTARAPERRRTTSADSAQPVFDFEAGTAATTNGATSVTAILGFLRAHDGWHAKADILAATGITDGQWNAAIADLIAGGRIERQGERRGTQYRSMERI